MRGQYQVTVFVQDTYSGEVLIRSDTTVDRPSAVEREVA